MLHRALEKILYWGLPLVLLTPLVMGQSLIFPFVTTKAFFFFILVDILFLCYLVLVTKKNLYPKKSKLLYLFLGITLLGFFLDLLGINFSHSFWGGYERMVGIYATLHFLLYLWMLLSVYDSKKKYTKLLNFSVIVSLLVSVYGLLQQSGVDLRWILQTGDVRTHSTLGNAAFLATYLLINIFFVLYLFFNNKNFKWRIFYITIFLFDLIVLFSTATRGALLGLMVGLIVMLVALVTLHKKKKIKIASGALLIILFCSVLSIFLFKDSNMVRNNTTLRRISEITWNEDTTKSRLLLWKMSYLAAQDRLLIGHGTNNIRIPLDKYHDFQLDEDWFDSSHNKFFDELLAHGVIGLLAYLIFLIALFWVTISKIRTKDTSSQTIILIGLLTAYITQSLFVFDSFVGSLLFFFMLGLFFLREDDGAIFNKKFSFLLSIFVCAGLLIVSIFVYSRTIPPAYKIILAFNTNKANISETTNLFVEANKSLLHSRDVLASSMVRKTQEMFSGSRNQDFYTSVQIKRYFDLISDVYNKSFGDFNDYSRLYINLAKLYQIGSVYGGLDYLDKSMDLLYQAQLHTPNRVDIYYALSQGHFFKGDYALAEDTLNEALELGVRQKDIYLKLAQMQARKGDAGQIKVSLDKAEKFGKEMSVKLLEEFTTILFNRGEWNAYLDILFRIDKLKPEDPHNYYSIAIGYKNSGDDKEAVKWAEMAVDLDSSLTEEVDKFIQGL